MHHVARKMLYLLLGELHCYCDWNAFVKMTFHCVIYYIFVLLCLYLYVLLKNRWQIFFETGLLVYRLKFFIWLEYMSSVLWCCWLGDRKDIHPVKNWVSGEVLAWLSVWSEVQMISYGPMVHLMPLPPRHLLLHWSPEWFTFLVPVTWVVLEKRPLNRCSSSVIGG